MTIVDINPVKFIHGDNMEFLRDCKDKEMYKYFHLAVVDPPYGIGVGSMNLGATKDSAPRDFKMGKWDNGRPTQEYWDLLWYCCRNIIVWGGNYFVSNFGQTKNDDSHTPITDGRCFIVWDKMNDKLSFSFGELALTTFDKNAVTIRRARNSTTEEDYGTKRHPTQKPVYLYDYILQNFTERGNRVLDTHGGSHTHAIAAYKNAINLTIIERDKTYHESGIAAYNEIIKQPRLLF